MAGKVFFSVSMSLDGFMVSNRFQARPPFASNTDPRGVTNLGG